MKLRAYLQLDDRRFVIIFFSLVLFQSVSCGKVNPVPNTGFSGHTHTHMRARLRRAAPSSSRPQLTRCAAAADAPISSVNHRID